MVNGYTPRPAAKTERGTTGEATAARRREYVCVPRRPTYGLGLGGIGEFKTASPFERDSRSKLNGVDDDTPRGEKDLAEQELPQPAWKKKLLPLDNDAIRYVAVTTGGDFVDSQNPDTGRREGANLNKRLDLGLSFAGHEKIMRARLSSPR